MKDITILNQRSNTRISDLDFYQKFTRAIYLHILRQAMTITCEPSRIIRFRSRGFRVHPLFLLPHTPNRIKYWSNEAGIQYYKYIHKWVILKEVTLCYIATFCRNSPSFNAIKKVNRKTYRKLYSIIIV